MDTPICDFAENYAKRNNLRLHMPGHKGRGAYGEAFDITEIDGADSLYEASGIIKESENNASKLFGANTFYSAEGSSLAIRAMLYLAVLYAKSQNRQPIIAAGRNAHKTFVSTAALLDFKVDWLAPEGSSYLSCPITEKYIRDYLNTADILPSALYITSPDYLGNMCDIKGIAKACKEKDVLLLVDNAHGAYLKFLPESKHPMDCGASMCCDSAHKTLHALTGAAYLHISVNAPEFFINSAKNALALFGSTSPSYLILQSLDRVNKHLANGYAKSLEAFVIKLDALKSDLIAHGYTLTGNEPMKLTVAPESYGYTGTEIAEYLLKNSITPEFSDPENLVLMPTPETSDKELLHLKNALLNLPRKTAIETLAPKLHLPKVAMSPREAVLQNAETLPVSECLGKILSAVTVGCPPAVPIAVSGEIIDEEIIKCFSFYGITHCTVVKEV